MKTVYACDLIQTLSGGRLNKYCKPSIWRIKSAYSRPLATVTCPGTMVPLGSVLSP